MPVGRSPKLDAHQPTVIITPTAAPVAGQCHLPCSGSPRARASQRPTPTSSTAITTQGGTPSTLYSVGASPPPSATVVVCSDTRSGDSAPARAAVAPMAKPSSTTQAPMAPSPTRYHVLPEQPPERIMPKPKS